MGGAPQTGWALESRTPVSDGSIRITLRLRSHGAGSGDGILSYCHAIGAGGTGFHRP